MLALARLQVVVFGVLAGVEWPLVILATNVDVDVAMVIAALFTGTVSLIAVLVASYTAIVATRTKKIADQTHDEVKTINSLTLGRASDLTEKRRIEKAQDTGQTVTQEDVQHVRDVNASELEEAKHEKEAKP